MPKKAKDIIKDVLREEIKEEELKKELNRQVKLGKKDNEKGIIDIMFDGNNSNNKSNSSNNSNNKSDTFGIKSFKNICKTVMDIINEKADLCNDVQDNEEGLRELKNIYNKLEKEKARKIEFIFNTGWDESNKFSKIVDKITNLLNSNNDTANKNIFWNSVAIMSDRAGLIKGEKFGIEAWHYPLLREFFKDEKGNYLLPLCVWKGDVVAFIMAFKVATQQGQGQQGASSG